MASSHSLSQNIPADILGLVFQHVEDGDTLTGLWEREWVHRATLRSVSLMPLTHVCVSWRSVALGLFYQTTETYPVPTENMIVQPKHLHPTLRMAADINANLYVRFAHIFLTTEGIEDNSAVNLLSSGQLGSASFPNVADLKLSFVKNKRVAERAEVHLDDQIARLSARLRELFPNSRAISFFALQNLEDCEVEAFYGLASKSSASPHSLIYRSRSPCSSTLLAPNLTSLRRIHISSPTSSAAARLIRASSKSLEELRLYKPSPEALEEIIAYKEPHRYPSLKKLTLYCTNFTDVKGVKEDAVIFPALTHLALIDCYRIASFDILVRGATSTLTHLSFNMTNMAIAGLRNHRFLNLKRVCVLTCGSIKSENPTYEVGDTIRLPFEIAPSAEAIEFYGYLDDLPPNIPDALLDCGISFSLSYLCLHQTNFTISQIGQLLVHADMVIRLTVNNIIAVNDKEMAVPDKFIEEFLTNGEPFSRRLTRLDVCIKRTHPATLILAITKLPSLSRVCLSCYTPQFYIADLMDELERPVFQEHRHHVHRVSLGTTRYSTSSFNPDRL